MSLIKTNSGLKETASEAKDNWLLDDETDPDGKIEAGLEVIAQSDLDDDQVADLFQSQNFPSVDKWDALEIYAKALMDGTGN